MINSMLSLVLPAYNEEANLESVVNEGLTVLSRYFARYEIIIVNDGSKDKTPQIADKLAAANPALVRAVHHQLNKGYGGALTNGFQAANGDYLMFIDSENVRQFKLDDIGLLAPYVNKADIIAGYRKPLPAPFYRFLPGYSFNFIVTVLFGIHLRDVNCAFKIFRAAVLKDIELTSPAALINTEIQAKAKRQGCSIIEVGVNYYPRPGAEQSRVSIWLISPVLLETGRLWRRMRKYVAPQAAHSLTNKASSLPPISVAASIVISLFVIWRLLRRLSS